MQGLSAAARVFAFDEKHAIFIGLDGFSDANAEKIRNPINNLINKTFSPFRLKISLCLKISL